MDDFSLSELLIRLSNIVSAELRTAASSQDLKPVQLQALTYLVRCNRYSDTPAALTEYLGLTKGTVSQTLIALETKGLVKKSADSNDGRLIHLSLTSKGRSLTRKAETHAFEELDHTSLKKSLFDLLSTLQRMRGGRSFGVCSTCSHFETATRGFRCGLTGEPLTRTESHKICREHEAA